MRNPRNPYKKPFDLPTLLIFAVPAMILAILTWRFVQKGKIHQVLIDAAEKGDTTAVKRLLVQGADINDKNSFGQTLIMIAARNHNRDMVRLLIERGSNLNVIDLAHDNALLLALSGAGVNSEIVKMLADRGADPTCADTSGNTPLIQAAEWGDLTCVKYLLVKHPNVNAKNLQKSTALTLAVSHNKMDIVQVLLDNGADPNIRDYLGQTALQYASNSGITGNSSIPITKLLLAHGADPNIADKSGMTPLQYAIQRKQAGLVAVLTSAQGKQKVLTQSQPKTK